MAARVPVLGVAVLLVAHGVANAQPADVPAQIETGGQVRQVSGVQAAELLMQAGRLDDARKVLVALQKVRPDDSEVLFLLGMLDVQQKDYAGAIQLFRKILVREPSVARVRLELARAFFLKHDYDNAERQFRFARAARLPPEVMANIDHYLYAIRQQRRWTSNLSIAIAPDTNLNAGPAVTQIDIFGLPFQLSDQTRQHSGVGAALDTGGEWAAPIGPNLRMRLGSQFHGLVYPNQAYDDLSLAVYAGPQILVRRWDISPMATVFRRWYGGRLYDQGAGGTLGATYYLSSRLGVSGSAGGQRITYPVQPAQAGNAISGALGGFFTPSPVSVVRGSIAVTRLKARDDAYAYTSGQVALGYDRDLPGGLSVSIAPSYTYTRYDAPLAGFGIVRRDRQFTAQVTLLSRRIEWAGFAPRLLYAFTRNASDIPLYSFDRNRFEIGLTRVF